LQNCAPIVAFTLQAAHTLDLDVTRLIALASGRSDRHSLGRETGVVLNTGESVVPPSPAASDDRTL